MRLIRVTNPAVMDSVVVIGSTTEHKEKVREELRGLMEQYKNNCFVQVAIAGTEIDQDERIEAWSFTFAPLDADFVLCTQAWATPEGSKQRMPDKMLLRGIHWAQMNGRVAIRMITERSDQPFMRRWGFEVESYTMRLAITDDFENKLINRLEGANDGKRQSISEFDADRSTEGRTLGSEGHLHGEAGIQDGSNDREDGGERIGVVEQQRVRKSATLASDVTVPVELGIDQRLRERESAHGETRRSTQRHPVRETIESVVERLDAEVLRASNPESGDAVVPDERSAEDQGGIREHGGVLLADGSGNSEGSDTVGDTAGRGEGTADVQRSERTDSTERSGSTEADTGSGPGESNSNAPDPSGTGDQSSVVPPAKQS